MKAILTRVAVRDSTAGPRFNVGIEHPDGRQITRFLIRGPWCRTTARQKAADLQADIDAGAIRDPWRHEHEAQAARFQP